jgi:adenosine deaminase
VADFAPAFRIAVDAGLLATPHAGFYTPASHVRDCVELLGADRIGHGTAAATDPVTLALLADRQVALEICPTSYPPLGVHELADVPIPSLLGAGVPVALASDDPLLFGVGLAGQYAIGREAIGLSDDELAAIAAHSVNASAAPAPVKRRLLAGVEDWRRAPA